ncbi:MAG: hypothetical protein ABI399_04630 [Bauldia sp.]
MIDGIVVRDDKGMDLPDLAAARKEALSAARKETVQRLADGRGLLNGAFLITAGAGGDPLLTVPFEAALGSR